jgi:hypothetical protein
MVSVSVTEAEASEEDEAIGEDDTLEEAEVSEKGRG